MTARRLIHALTPGDHFSPRTGSAIPSVVDGLARHAPADQQRSAVLVARGTYEDRYDSADVWEYEQAPPLPGRFARVGKLLDVAAGALGAGRPVARRAFQAQVAAQAQWDPGCVLAHNMPQLVPLVDATRHAPVLYAHNLLFSTYTRREVARVLGSAHRIVAVSDFLANELSKSLPPGLRRLVRVVHNGVDRGLFDAPPRPRADRLRIVYVGRMIPDKGVHVLIDAYRSMRHREDAVLTLIGASGFSASDPLTPYERRLRRQAAGDPGIVFRSFLPRRAVAAELRAGDVLVVPSNWPEPFGLTVLEGMASGLAVVASRVGGVPEALDGAGLDFAPGDSDELAAILDSLADDETLRFEWATRGYASAQRRDWTAAADALARALVI